MGRDRSRFGNTRRRRGRLARLAELTALFLVVLVVSTGAAPQLLAWPYSTDIGATRVYSERPIPPEMARVLARSDALLATSPINDSALSRTIFLSDGGWRWNVLALTTRGAFAFPRPWRDAIIVNRSDVAQDRVENGRAIGGRRTLSGTIAHETVHILIARRYGEPRVLLLPGWKTEGYADYVAAESSLSDADYQRLRRSDPGHLALPYYEGRRRVDQELRRNGRDVDRLFLASQD